MAVHTWISIVFTALLTTGVVSYISGFCSGSRSSSRYHHERRAVASWETAGHTPAPESRPPGAPSALEPAGALGAPGVVHLHLHHCPTGVPGQPPWVAVAEPVIEGQVVRELPRGLAQ